MDGAPLAWRTGSMLHQLRLQTENLLKTVSPAAGVLPERDGAPRGVL
jgi:hypothetical protein